MWSASQDRAGRVHQGKTQVWSRTAITSRCRSGTTGVSTGSWAVGVEDRFHDHLAGRTAQVAELAGGDQVVAVFEAGGERVVGDVDVEDDLMLGLVLGVVVSRRARGALLSHREVHGDS